MDRFLSDVLCYCLLCWVSSVRWLWVRSSSVCAAVQLYCVIVCACMSERWDESVVSCFILYGDELSDDVLMLTLMYSTDRLAIEGSALDATLHPQPLTRLHSLLVFAIKDLHNI